MSRPTRVTVSGGLGIANGLVADGGTPGSPTLLSTVNAVAKEMSQRYDAPVVIRFSADGKAGGAWLHTTNPDRLGLNSEVGVNVTLGSDGLVVSYIVSEWASKDGEYHHEQVETVWDALDGAVSESLDYQEVCQRLRRETRGIGGAWS